MGWNNQRNLIFIGATVGAAILFLLLPAAISRPLFGILLVGTLVVTVYQFLQQSHEIPAFQKLIAPLTRTVPFLPRISTLLAFLVMLLCAAMFSQQETIEQFQDTLVLVVVGVGIIGGAVWSLALPHPQIRPFSALSLSQSLRGGLVFVLGVLLLAALAENNGGLLGIAFLEGLTIHFQFFLLVTGILCVVWGIAGTPIPRIKSLRLLPSQEIVLVMAITLTALILRGYQAGSWIRGMIDETHFVIGVSDITYNDETWLLAQAGSTRAFTILHSYWQYLSAEIFGRELFALRIVSGIVGALTVPALYLLARELFDKKTAFVAAGLLATFPPHVHFSRVGSNNISDPLFGTLAFAFLARGLRTHRRLDFALAGAALGMTQYFYEGGRLFFPLLMGGWLAVLFVRWRVHWQGIVIMLMVALTIGIPVYYTIEGRSDSITWRMDQTSLSVSDWLDQFEIFLKEDTPPHITRRFAAPFMFLVQIRDDSLFYGGEEPLLLIFVLPFFLIGVSIALWRIWHPAMILILAWVFVGTFGNTKMHDVIQFQRYVFILPALMLLAAIGLSYSLSLLRLLPKYQGIMAGMLVIAIGIAHTNYYFYDHAPLLVEQSRGNTNADDDAIFRAIHLPPDTQVIVITDEPFSTFGLSALLGYLQPDPTLSFHGFSEDSLSAAWLATFTRDRNLAIFVDGDNMGLRRIVEIYYHIENPTFSPYNVPRKNQMALYFIPRLPAPTPEM